MKKHIPFGLRLIVAIILLQTLRFKFTAHPDSVYIFSKVGLEPLGRIIIGILELIAGVLLLIPKTVWVGATLSLVIIGGAIIIHFTKLGIEINNDGGTLFATAIITFLLSAMILFIHKKDISFLCLS
ncbi:DoxX family protein [Seonamhaeicola sediminis]|uniref:DoxX family protein n=1 Tax=Seonamhaeicola sediminis TaxID=2528206 RepID=A0A562Y918_9FLAO|nr:DoxX family protein [Seonamhaeicola sediminis]TWO30883.1 DoxX family protein [Seonamhaeicola sediminis]